MKRCTSASAIAERGRGAFTLIELLLVVAIFGVVAAVTVPTFVKSMRGNRLRAAVRTVIMAGRYARSMALLNQEEMAVVFDLDGGKVSVLNLGQRAPPVGEGAAGLAGQGEAAVLTDSVLEGAGGSPSNAPAAGAGRDEIVRVLDLVKITYVAVEGGEELTSGSARVVYASNGRCTPYRVGLSDEQGGAAAVSVDALAAAETEAQRQ